MMTIKGAFERRIEEENEIFLRSGMPFRHIVAHNYGMALY
jgi:hypothetical protein